MLYYDVSHIIVRRSIFIVHILLSSRVPIDVFTVIIAGTYVFDEHCMCKAYTSNIRAYNIAI